MAYSITFNSQVQTLVENHGTVAVIRHEFSRKADTFYTVRDIATGRDFSHTYRLLRNARRVARTVAR